MFDFIRSHQRLMQFLLLVLIVPSFALIGVSGYSSYVSGDYDLVKVGKSAITMQEYERARSNQLQQMQQMSPGGFDPAVLDDPIIRANLLESLIDYRVLASTAADERFSVSDTVLRQAIAAMPQLQVDGQFSPDRYNEVLASVGMTTRDFEQSQRFELALERVLGPVAKTTRVPTSVVHNLEHALTEARTVRLKVYESDAYIDQVNVSNADIQTWYDEHKQDYEIPEQVSMQYLLLDEAAAMANLPEITEQELKAYYDQNKTRFTQVARTELSHIQINVPAGATQEQRDEAHERATSIAEKVRSDPLSFADMAIEHSDDAGSARNGGALGWITQGTWPAALDRAVFELEKGQVSEAVEGTNAYHIFLANDVRPEEVESFDEVSDTIRQEVQRQLGAERFADMATRLTGLIYDNPESLEPAAQALSMNMKSASGITRDTLLSAADAGDDAAASSDDASILNDVRVRRALFSPQVLNQGHNSGIIEISPDTMLVVRVTEQHPAHIPDLERVADRVRAQITSQRAHALAVEAGQEFLSSLQQGMSESEWQERAVADSGESESPDEVAAETEGTTLFGEPLTISRINPQGVDKALLDSTLALDAELPAYTGVESRRGFVVARVEERTTESTDSSMLAALPEELRQLWGQAEERAVLQAMRVQTEVELLPEAHDVINTSDSAD